MKNWTKWHTAGILALLAIIGGIGWFVPGRGFAWIVVLGLLGGSVIVAGMGINGKPWGAFIDERNKISLSRLQIVFWTILVLSAYLTAALGNIGFYQDAFQLFQDSQQAALQVEETPDVEEDNEANEADILEENQDDLEGTSPSMTFAEALAQVVGTSPLGDDPMEFIDALGDALAIAVPQELWLLMGISTTALIGTPLIRSNQTKKDPKKEQGGEEEIVAAVHLQAKRQGEDDVNKITTQGVVLVNKDIDMARFGDLFETETIGKVNQLDLGKVQNFYFTAILLLVYGVLLFNTFASVNLITELPAISASMLALMGISQAGYLVSKAVPGNINATTLLNNNNVGANDEPAEVGVQNQNNENERNIQPDPNQS